MKDGQCFKSTISNVLGFVLLEPDDEPVYNAWCIAEKPMQKIAQYFFTWPAIISPFLSVFMIKLF